jgi:hypothetical protein
VARRRGRGANAGLWKCSIDASSQSFFRQREAKRLLLLGVSALPKQTLPTGIAARDLVGTLRREHLVADWARPGLVLDAMPLAVLG